MDKFLKRKSDLPASTPTSSKIPRTDVTGIENVTEPPAAAVHEGTRNGKHNECSIGWA